MVEQDTGAAEHVIGFPVLFCDPEAILLGNGIGRVGMERCVLVLRYLFDLAVEFRC